MTSRKNPRNRKNGSLGSINCAIAFKCERPEKGSSRCGKRRCNYFKDPMLPKYRK